MTTDVITLTPESSVRDALEALGRHHIGGAPVVTGNKLIGVVTAADLISFLASLPGVPTEHEEGEEWGVRAEEKPSDTVDESEPSSAYFSELWDDAGAEVTERIARVIGPEWNVLEEHDVSEAMTREPLVTLPATADIEAAANLMKDKGIHRVLVTDSGKLAAIVSALDIAKAVADRKVARRVYAFGRDQDFRDAE